MNILHFRYIWLMIWALSAGFAFPAIAQDSGFRAVTGPCGLTFPRDHGPHPNYRTEWWYYTGNVTDEENRAFGFQLTFFRRGIQSPEKRKTWPNPASAWRTDQVYLAHAAVSDIKTGRHMQAEQMARPALSMAGTEQTGDRVTIHLNDWQTVITPGGHQLEAEADGFAFALDLTPVKPVVLHGDNGYSSKGPLLEHASCYYSFTRLQVQGVLTIDNTRHTVKGSAWMDHEFSTAPLGSGIVGWDWFSLQMSDRSEVMIYLLRHEDGTWDKASGGTYVAPDGRSRKLGRDDMRIKPLSHWTSPRSGASYPIKWQVKIESLNLDLEVVARLAHQEMHTPRTTRVIYWEGSVHAAGEIGNNAVEGVGYVELTGYAEHFDAPL